MGGYIGVDNKARNIIGGYIGVDGVARKIVKGYIGDSNGKARLFWSGEEPSLPIILEVEKITSDTYAGETTYTGEEFILLDIYPKTNGTVNVTYGGLTKTITFSESNAQQVFFGTFNGVSDSVTTPDSGTLTIDGDWKYVTVGTFVKDSKNITQYCGCVTAVIEWGNQEMIMYYAFTNCAKLTLNELPNGISEIGMYAFSNCTNLALTSLPNSVQLIGGYAFQNCTNLALTSLPSELTSIGSYAFYHCKNINITEIPHGVTNIGDHAFYMEKASSSTAMYGNTIILPSTLQSIGDYAFCSAETNSDGSVHQGYLAGVKILATTPPTISYDAFGEPSYYEGGVGDAIFTITVPKGCGEAYKTAEGWSGFANQIVEAS